MASSGLSGVINGFNTTLALSGNDVILMVVPEPGSLTALLAGTATLLGLRRRRSATR